MNRRQLANIEINVNKGKIKFNYFISLIMVFFAVIIIAWMNYGVFTFALPYVPNYIRYGLYFIWFTLAVVSNKKFIKIFLFQTWPLLVFYIYIFYISAFVYMDLQAEIKSITYLIIVYSIFLYYFNIKHKIFSKIICVFLIFDFIIVSINTYIQLQIDPLVSRILATGVETREILLGDKIYCAVGSYGFFYGLVAIILLLGFLLLYYNKNKLIVFTLLISEILLLFKAQFAIAIIAMFSFLILMLIIRYTNKYVTAYIVVLVFVLTVLFQNVLAVIFYNVATFDKIPPVVAEKLNDISIYLSEKNLQQGTQVEGRKQRYYMSINAFADNVLTGTVTSYDAQYKSGGHSAWLDMLATFGLCSSLFFVFLYKAYKYCKNQMPLMFRIFVNIYWFYFICIGFINTLLFSSIYVVWFLFLPLFIVNFLDNKVICKVNY